MLTYKGGQTVGKGTYWDLASGRRVDVTSEAVLAGGTATYVRMSAGVMLLSGPLIGLLYTILMPFIGIASLAALAARSGLGGLYNLAAKSVSFGWRPINAYLSGRKKRNVRR
ncbi:MAG TPA: hypothetical protein DCP92_15110 [Nitrospiraceae bacterium]|jgi:hypothetical protein|nr:hypothetical protein [Nitrospiraceae bacterium]